MKSEHLFCTAPGQSLRRLSVLTADRRASLEEVAEQFEAIFVNELMKSSRAAKLSDDILSNSGTQPFLEMMDREFSQKISKRNSLGIAEALVQQFKRK